MKYRFTLLCDPLLVGKTIPDSLTPVERRDSEDVMSLVFEREGLDELALVQEVAMGLWTCGINVKMIEVFEVYPHPSLRDYDNLVTVDYDQACEAAHDSLENQFDILDPETAIKVRVEMNDYTMEDFYEVFDE